MTQTINENDTGAMADDQYPEDFAVICPYCQRIPGKRAGPNWLKNHLTQEHKERRNEWDPLPSANPDPTPSSQGVMELTVTEKKLVKDLQVTLATPTLFLMAINFTDGMLVMAGTEDLCVSLVLASRKSKKLRKFLTAVIEGVVWLAVGTAVANIVLPILDNHGILSVPTMRVVDKLPTGAIGSPEPATSPSTSTKPRPATNMRPEPVHVPTMGAMGDTTFGMNRAARRAIEPDGSSIPPDLAAVAASLGVSDDDLNIIAKSMGIR